MANNYSPEIIRQAEELIEKHMLLITNGGYGYVTFKKVWLKSQYKLHSDYTNSIKAAIVSCEFAIAYGGRTITISGVGVDQIKLYLEELL